MAVYLKLPDDTFVRWTGELINDVRHPLNIEQLWTVEQLAEIGLYEPLPSDPIPRGKVFVGKEIKEINGIVKWVNIQQDPQIFPEESQTYQEDQS